MKWLNHKLYIEPIDCYIDPVLPVERAIITHGHADHARAGHAHVLATPQTIDIMQARYGTKCAGHFQSLPKKDFFGNKFSPFNLINKKPLIASSRELSLNSRSRSAKLRAAERKDDG